MGSEWNATTLGKLGSFRNGVNFSREQEGNGVPVLKVKDFGDRTVVPSSGLDELTEEQVTISSEHYLQAGDTVIMRSNGNPALVGRSMFFPGGTQPVTFSGFCIRFRPDLLRINPRFAAYLIRSPYFRNRFSSHGSGTGITNLSQDLLAAVPVMLPELAEQLAIANVISALDNKIELSRDSNITLERIAQTTFKSWFVDFDPVRAKAEGREPEGMDAATAALFPSFFQESELHMIPEGWRREPIGNLTEVVGGSTPSTTKSAYWQNGEHFWATPKDLSNNQSPILLSTERKVTADGLRVISSGLLPPGTILLSSRAPIGYLALAAVPVAINQGFIAMKPFDGVPNTFLLLWTEFAMDRIKSLANGSTFQEISKRNFRTITLVRPPPSVLSVFAGLAEPIYDRIAANAEQVQTLAELRDTLLPRLISGKLRVPEAEKLVEAVL